VLPTIDAQFEKVAKAATLLEPIADESPVLPNCIGTVGTVVLFIISLSSHDADIVMVMVMDG
jgi:hypothetical protein